MVNMLTVQITKYYGSSRLWWHMPIIKALWKTEARELQVQIQAGQLSDSLNFLRTYICPCIHTYIHTSLYINGLGVWFSVNVLA